MGRGCRCGQRGLLDGEETKESRSQRSPQDQRESGVRARQLGNQEGRRLGLESSVSEPRKGHSLEKAKTLAQQWAEAGSQAGVRSEDSEDGGMVWRLLLVLK